MNKTSEARLKAQKKYWENHRDYYRKLSLNEAKRVRIQRKKYKQALLDIKEYIEHENFKREILVGVSTKKYTRNILNNILDIVNKEIGEDNGR